ncbi:hypothetical protein SLEP1_g27381 [Rubroshorea leprosula]|uniref:Uncharacterized protein n=1 Tax=Rubroshorea leprosula TaxID=152421 RepID=A0AAV5JXB4_9ROSI|nr:hypothetical protein SLEP1_g27381 [Rubroshorea leprosula]
MEPSSWVVSNPSVGFRDEPTPGSSQNPGVGFALEPKCGVCREPSSQVHLRTEDEGIFGLGEKKMRKNRREAPAEVRKWSFRTLQRNDEKLSISKATIASNLSILRTNQGYHCGFYSPFHGNCTILKLCRPVQAHGPIPKLLGFGLVDHLASKGPSNYPYL